MLSLAYDSVNWHLCDANYQLKFCSDFAVLAEELNPAAVANTYYVPLGL